MKLLLLPLISAFIGWITNYLAIKMIFRPLEPVRVLGITFQGIAPQRRHHIAENIGTLVANDLVMLTDVTAMIDELGVHAAIERLVDLAGERIRERVTEMLPAASLMTEETYEEFKRLVKEEVRSELHLVTDHIVQGLHDKIDIRRIVVDRLASYDYAKLEKLALDVARRELKIIELFGGVVGFLIGIVQVAILVLL